MAKKTIPTKASSAERKSVVRRTEAAVRPPAAPAIDFPRADEPIRPGHYAIRLTCGPATFVQVRINGESWKDCRQSVGHHWYDWAPRSGEARIESRGRRGKARWSPGEVRVCVVSDAETSAN